MKMSNMYKVLATTAILSQSMVVPALSYADTVPTNVETQKPQNAYGNQLGNGKYINFTQSEEEDFGDKSKEDAKNGIAERIKEQEKKLSSSEVQALHDFITKDNKNVNEYLVKINGKLMDQDPMNEKIEKLDNILKHQQTERTIKVYQSIPNMKIEQAENLRGTISPKPTYRITSLTKVSGSDALLEITVPKESHAAYEIVNDSAGLITERGTGLKVTNVRTFNDRGAPRIKIEATLLSSEEMKAREIKSEALKAANQMLTGKIGLPVNLDLKDLEKSEATIAKANEFIVDVNRSFKDLAQTLPNVKDGKELFKKLIVAGVTIKLQDHPINLKDLKVAGSFNVDTKELQIDLTKQSDIENTFIHELGHAIDYKLLNTISQNNTAFQNIFSQEKQAYTKVFRFDIDKLYPDLTTQEKSGEYFADAFAKFVLEPERLKQVTPQTYQFIKNNISKLLFM
ncbi:hypothetical protein ER45_029910 (plasmid) [Bacillus mycoides]|nr:hypothetical protein ER45_029910 [Bacillus mycoides]